LLLRDILENKYGTDRIDILGTFILPDVISKVIPTERKRDVYANAYASFKELQAIITSLTKNEFGVDLEYKPEQVNSEGIIACTAYELNNTDSGSELAVYVDSTQTSGRILLTTFYISSEGDVAPPEDYMTDYLYNRALLDGHLRLSRYGMSPEFSASGSWLTTADVCRVLIDYYEASTGKEVDTSRVDLGVADESFMK